MFFSISLHVPGPTLWVSHFARFSMILAIFQVLPYEFLIFLVSQFSQHIPGPRVCMPHFPRFFFSYLTILQVLKYMFLIFHVFQCFSPYSTSYSLLFSFSMIFTFPSILQVLQCAFLIFHDFECFSPYSWSYSVHFSFSTFLSVSNHVGGPTLCVFHFP